MVGSKIKIVKNGEIKIISEIETIDGVDIFYMTDNTSYSLSEIHRIETEPISLCEKISEPQLIDTVINSKNNYNAGMKMMADLASQTTKKILKKEKRQISFKIFGWTITFSKSK
jgi:hypothetical protein